MKMKRQMSWAKVVEDGKIEHYLGGHGHFKVSEEDFAYAMRLPKKQLVKVVAEDVYDPYLDGGKKSHWKRFSKEEVALVYADTAGRGRGLNPVVRGSR